MGLTKQMFYAQQLFTSFYWKTDKVQKLNETKYMCIWTAY